MQNRREFLNMLCRGSILTGLAATTGLLVYRSAQSGNCQLGSSCANCGKSGNCNLPQALLYKETVWQLDPAKCI